MLFAKNRVSYVTALIRPLGKYAIKNKGTALKLCMCVIDIQLDDIFFSFLDEFKILDFDFRFRKRN